MSERVLRELDPEILSIASGAGTVMVSNRFQGRIFVAVAGRLLHRFDAELAAAPDPEKFNNLGGNSLWPAPEGGNFAFNYPPAGEWRVLPAINCVPTGTLLEEPGRIVVSKEIELENRRGKHFRVLFRREVSAIASDDVGWTLPPELSWCGYHSIDELIPEPGIPLDAAVLAAWSLEQFPGAENIIAFGRCAGSAAGCINDDFYGDPSTRISCSGRVFRFELGGEKRLQIGVSAACAPEFIGSLDRGRGVLSMRFTPSRTDGRYINIADNDQPRGVYSAADMFSIFNGASETDFHELETIAPMGVAADGTLGASRLESTTRFYIGDGAVLEEFLRSAAGVDLRQSAKQESPGS